MQVKAKTFLLGAFISLAAILIGGFVAIHQVKNGADKASFLLTNGAWRVNPVMDLEKPMQRALISLKALFALRESEVIYFTASVDDEGNPLTSAHDYVMTGIPPDARYWSFTLYGQDFFLIPNEDKLYGYNAETITYTPLAAETEHPEEYAIYISSSHKENNWLPSGQNDQLTITLRLYNPSPSVYKNLTTIELPQIKRLP